MTCGIYCIENTINYKKYIGQSCNIEKRVGGHLKKLKKGLHDNPHLQSSFNIYGIESFTYYILRKCKKETLDKLEIYYISYYNSADRENGYNILTGGGGTRGRIVSEETRKKLSVTSTGRIFSKERNEKISKAKKGKSITIPKKQRDKITKAITGRKIKTRKTTSLFRGVSYCSRDKCWSVYLKNKRYGSFKDEIIAAKKYDEISWNLLHDLGKLNFPENYGEKNAQTNI